MSPPPRRPAIERLNKNNRYMGHMNGGMPVVSFSALTFPFDNDGHRLPFGWRSLRSNENRRDGASVRGTFCVYPRSGIN